MNTTLITLTLSLALSQADTGFTLEPGFKLLLNGKDLTGWRYKDGPAFDGKTNSSDGRYSAKDGKIIVNPGKGLAQMWTVQEFPTDFHLKLEFRAEVNADSGIFLRKPQLQCRDYLVAGPYKDLKKYKACALKTLLLDDTLVENLYDGDINHKSYNMDISRLLDQVESTEVCYIDSPYNTRKYDDNYHLLETISKYDYPKIKGKTGLRDTNVSKSKFCSKVEVKGAFDDIYSRIKSKYIFVSYSSEGLVSKDDMIEMMKKYWTNVVCYEKDYQRFKSNRNNQMSDGVIEYLFAGTKK